MIVVNSDGERDPPAVAKGNSRTKYSPNVRSQSCQQSNTAWSLLQLKPKESVNGHSNRQGSERACVLKHQNLPFQKPQRLNEHPYKKAESQRKAAPSTFRVLPGLIWQHITTRHAFRMKCTRFSFNRKAEASRQDDKNIIATIRHVFQQKGDEMAKMKCEGSNGIANRL